MHCFFFHFHWQFENIDQIKDMAVTPRPVSGHAAAGWTGCLAGCFCKAASAGGCHWCQVSFNQSLLTSILSVCDVSCGIFKTMNNLIRPKCSRYNEFVSGELMGDTSNKCVCMDLFVSQPQYHTGAPVDGPLMSNNAPSCNTEELSRYANKQQPPSRGRAPPLWVVSRRPLAFVRWALHNWNATWASDATCGSRG